MKEIIIYSPGAYSAYGHSFDYSKGLAESFIALDYKVHIYGVEGTLKFPDTINQIQFQTSTKDISKAGLLQKIRWGFQRVLSSGELIKDFNTFYLSFSEKPMVIFETFEYFSLARHIKLYRLNYFCVFHDTNFNFKQTSVVAGVYKYLAKIPSRKIVKNSIKSFVHGEKMKVNFANQMGIGLKDRIEQIPYGAPTPHKVHANQKEVSQDELKLDKAKYYLLSFGTLREDKEYLPIYEALKSTDNWLWIIAGPEGDLSYDTLRSELKYHNIVEKVTTFPRFITNKEQAAFFTACDVVINLYKPFIRHESGTAQLARTFNVPVIVSGPPDLTDYVDKRNIGWVLNEQRKLDQVLRHYETMDTKGLGFIKNNITKLALENSWPQVVERILGFK